MHDGGSRLDSSKPVEVAVVGGGCAALTAAYELSRPEHQGKYHVTVYQQGWRLGGKAASGRGPANRIEEHGLHIWLGFYENAFRLLREVYDELDLDPQSHNFAKWSDVFFADSHVGVASRDQDEWTAWTTFFPPADGLPGDPINKETGFTLQQYLGRAISLLRTLILSLDVAATNSSQTPPLTTGKSVLSEMQRILSLGLLTGIAGIVEALSLLEIALRASPVSSDNLIIRFVEHTARSARELGESTIAGNPELSRRWEIIDLVLAVAVGLIRDNVVNHPRGLDSIDEYECREWLKRNGASAASLDSGFIRGLYDLALAYEDGDPGKPGLAAGQAIRGSLRMFFTYRGALFWKMRGSMGDLVIAPYYSLLSRRGVTFKFFHRLRNVQLADSQVLKPGERPYVRALEFDVQAQVKGDGSYTPLVDVAKVPSWPAKPLFDQLVDGEQLAESNWDPESHWDTHRDSQHVLEVSKDFDFLVLGVGMGAIPDVCRELVETDDRWRDMVKNVKTVATQAFQVWLNQDLVSVGWNEPSVTLSAFKKPFDTWSDMTHLADQESWTPTPQSIAYFCGVLADPNDPDLLDNIDYPSQRTAEVKQNAIDFLNNDIRHLWPEIPKGRFNWDFLQSPESEASSMDESRGEVRFDKQYWTANVNPTDRYVLALPGTLKHRISPLDNTYDNMTIAGDWTDCGFNEGCVEAAVMSGRLAAHAISHSPPLEDITGYDYL